MDLCCALILEQDKKKKKEKKLIICLLAFLPSLLGGQRDSFYVRHRMNWAEHVHLLHQEGTTAFYAMYRMEYQSFQKLVDLIDSSVRKNGVMAEIRTGKSCGLITTEIHEEERGISDKLVFPSNWICTPAQISRACTLGQLASVHARDICAGVHVF